MGYDLKAVKLVVFQVLAHNELSKWKSPTYYSLQELLVPLNFCASETDVNKTMTENVSLFLDKTLMCWMSLSSKEVRILLDSSWMYSKTAPSKSVDLLKSLSRILGISLKKTRLDSFSLSRSSPWPPCSS